MLVVGSVGDDGGHNVEGLVKAEIILMAIVKNEVMGRHKNGWCTGLWVQADLSSNPSSILVLVHFLWL